jgi:hypothetical protein
VLSDALVASRFQLANFEPPPLDWTHTPTTAPLLQWTTPLTVTDDAAEAGAWLSTTSPAAVPTAAPVAANCRNSTRAFPSICSP